MLKKLILVLVLAFLFSFNLARADMVINEIMYDLDGGDIDYLEVLNNGSSNVDLTEYKFVVNNDSVNGHEISTNSGSQNLKPGDYGVIVASSVISNYINKWGSAGNIFTASFSFPNSITTTIILKNQSLIQINKAEYNPLQSGASSDGNSLQLINGEWKAALPTPGTANPTSTSDATDTPTTLATEPTIVEEPKPKVIENPTMKVKISASTLAFAGQPLEMQTSVVGLLNEKVVLGRAYWNFGDGSSFEQINNFEKFSHIYYYPGEYILFLEYYQNSFSKTPEATAKIIIKVLPTTVSISKVGDAKDFFIELSNSASSDIDISNWVINASGKIFILPKNSVIMSKKQMTISGKITGFSYGDQSNLKLYSGTGELIFDYSSSGVPVKIAKTVVSSTSSSILPIDKGEMPKAEEVYPDATQASVISSDVANSNPNNSYLPILISIIFIGASASTVYFIRRKKVTGKESDDFEILDE